MNPLHYFDIFAEYSEIVQGKTTHLRTSTVIQSSWHVVEVKSKKCKVLQSMVSCVPIIIMLYKQFCIVSN